MSWKVDGRWPHLYLHGKKRHDRLRMFCWSSNCKGGHLSFRSRSKLRAWTRTHDLGNAANSGVKVLRQPEVKVDEWSQAQVVNEKTGHLQRHHGSANVAATAIKWQRRWIRVRAAYCLYGHPPELDCLVVQPAPSLKAKVMSQWSEKLIPKNFYVKIHSLLDQIMAVILFLLFVEAHCKHLSSLCTCSELPRDLLPKIKNNARKH